MKIGIVGMGVAGVSVLRAMTQFSGYEQHEIVLFDVPQTFGTGLPYQPDTSVILLNQTAETMSLSRENRYEFARWAERKKGYKNPNKAHLPRPWFGEYMRDVMEKASEKLKPRVVEEQVIQMRLNEDQTISLQTGSKEERFDLVHLCIGHQPYQDPYNLIGHPHYVYHPYPVEEKLDNIPHGAKVGIIGTGLTAIDIMRYFRHLKEEIDIHFISDDGTFTTLRGDEPDLTLKHLTLEKLEAEKKHGLVPLERMLEWFKLECDEQGVDWKGLVQRFSKGTKEQLENQLLDERGIGVLQSIIHHMDGYLPEYWQALSEQDKQTFIENYRDTFEIFRSPIPRETVEEIVSAWRKGEIQVRGGMKAVEGSPTEFEVFFEEGESEKMTYLINATGQMTRTSISRYQPELINHALNTRLLQAEPFGGLQVLWPSSQALSQRFGIIENLYLHGQYIQGLQYGNNTAGMLRDHAFRVVEEISKQLFDC